MLATVEEGSERKAASPRNGTDEKRNLFPKEIREKKSCNLWCLQGVTFKNRKIGMFVPVLTATFSSTLFWCSSPAGEDVAPPHVDQLHW